MSPWRWFLLENSVRFVSTLLCFDWTHSALTLRVGTSISMANTFSVVRAFQSWLNAALGLPALSLLPILQNACHCISHKIASLVWL